MKAIICLFLLTLCLNSAQSQQCLNSSGQKVDWWVMLIYPESLPLGYAYFDSTFTSNRFKLATTAADHSGTPLERTL